MQRLITMNNQMLRICTLFLTLSVSFPLSLPAAAQSLADLVLQSRAAAAQGDHAAALVALEAARDQLSAPRGTASDPSAPRPAARDLAFVMNEIAVSRRGLRQPGAALEAASEAVALLEATGDRSDLLVVGLINLGLAAQDLRRFDQAGAALGRAAQIARALGNDRLELVALQGAGAVALQQGVPARTEAIVTAALALDGAIDPATGARLQHMRAKAFLQRRMPQAAVAALDAITGGELPEVLDLETALLRGRAALQQANPDRAETLLSQVSIDARDIAPDLWASALYNLAEVQFSRGRFAEAEIANQAAESAYTRVFGPDHPVIGQIRHRQAILLQQVGDLDLALARYDEALDLLGASLGTDHSLWWGTQAERAQALARQGRHAEALALARSVLQNRGHRPDAQGATDHPDISNAPDAANVLALASLGLALREVGDDEAARGVLEQVRAARAAAEQAGASFSIVDEPPGLNALAEIYLMDGRDDDARQLIERSLQILAALGSTGSDLMGEARRIRAAIALAQGDRAGATTIARENLAAAEAHLIELARTDSYAADFAPVKLRGQLVQAMDLLFTAPDAATPERQNEMFRAAQLVHLNETTRATNGFLRAIVGANPALAEDIDERRALLGAIRTLSEQVAQGTAETAVLDRLADLRTRRAALDAAITGADPAIAELLTPAPVSLGDAQALLPEGTGLWLHTALGSHGYVFLLARDTARLARTDLGEARLDATVRALRDTVDQGVGRGLVPFDFRSAAALYDGLFGPFEDAMAPLERVLLVPDLGAQQISLGVLVRSETPIGRTPEGADARFLGLTHALAVVPSVSSLAALQRAGIVDPTQSSFIGFGDPELEGTGLPDGFRGSPIDRLTGVARAGTVSAIFEPLPETVYELTAMASVIPEDRRRLFFRADATETQIKALSAAGGGADTGTLAFATHAIVSGEFDHRNEPALVLSPPDNPSSADDGLLTASEIAELDFNAAIVILSACNTGSPSGRSGAPGLSGLASGFFRAGAQSLVVSHWTISSISSVLIMPRFFGALSQTDPQPPSEALRRAMVAMSIRTDNADFAHPALWGPFTVVGAF